MNHVEQINMHRGMRNSEGAGDSTMVTLHGAFETQAEKTPDRIAIKFDHQELSYRELNEKADCLAAVLRASGVQQEDIVAICLERSFDMVVAVLGIAKAGAAYLAIDPSYPQSRIDFMLQDAGTRLLITHSQLAGHLIGHDLQRVELDKPLPMPTPSEYTSAVVTPNNLAYVIYTSGSTGMPKGVLIEHRGICNAIQAHLDQLDVSSETRFLQFASLSFDASLIEIFTPLWLGGTLIMASREVLLDEYRLAALVAAEEITAAILPPSMLKVIDVESLANVNVLLSVGEVCSPELARRWYEGRDFYNGYGPSENSVCTTLFVVRDAYEESVPIGKPIQNSQIYLLNGDLKQVSPGEVGEIYIGGAGLARGYLNRPDLTAEKFVSNPLDSSGKSRLYKTGDLARELSDGNLLFVGRVDHQVKIRGQRVELEEIDRAVTSHINISDAAVIVRKDSQGADLLVAYLSGTSTLDEEGLRTSMRQTLPEYMIPARFVLLEKLPLTHNGKIDRKALQQMPLDSEEAAPSGEASGSHVSWLSKTVREILGLSRVDIDQSIFNAGANSLHVTQLVSRIRGQYKIDLTLNTVFRQPTVKGLAACIGEQMASKNEPVNSRTALPSIKRVSREAVRLKR